MRPTRSARRRPGRTHILGLVAVVVLAERVVLYQPGGTTGQHDTKPGQSARLAHILGLTP